MSSVILSSSSSTDGIILNEQTGKMIDYIDVIKTWASNSQWLTSSLRWLVEQVNYAKSHHACRIYQVNRKLAPWQYYIRDLDAIVIIGPIVCFLPCEAADLLDLTLSVKAIGDMA